MDTKLVKTNASDLIAILISDDASKDVRSRISLFSAWMASRKRKWYEPDLAAYRDSILVNKKSTTVSAHLSTIRACYRNAMLDNSLRERVFNMAGDEMARLGHEDSPANRKAYVDELYGRLRNATHPDLSSVKVAKIQDRPDSEQIRLTRVQAEELMNMPGLGSLKALRDTAILTLLLCTGAREAELCALEVSDLRKELDGELSLHIRKGKGAKERLVPYGELDWCLTVVDSWLRKAQIVTGTIFRGFWHGNKKIRNSPLTVRAVEKIVSEYSITGKDGIPLTVHPHDLRRTYARQLYERGKDLVSIKDNLGHEDTKTTLLYIGNMNGARRRAPELYSFDTNRLKD